MVSHEGYPRRKQPLRGRRKPESARHASSSTEPTTGVATREALDIASYVSDMTAQLEAMAQAAGLDLLSYFLGMSRSEADLFIRTNAGPEGEPTDDDDADSSPSDEGQAEFDSSGG